MEIWTVFGAMWLSLWIMAVWKTYPAIITLASGYSGGELIMNYRIIHAILYVVIMFFLSPFVWQICFFEEPRRNFIVSYVHSILKGENK